MRRFFLIPVGAALGIGLWLGFQQQAGQARRIDEKRLQELRDQAKFLTESVSARLAQVRAQTLLSLERKEILHDSILEIGRARKTPDGKLDWLFTAQRSGVTPVLVERGDLSPGAISQPPHLILAYSLGAEIAAVRIDAAREFGVFDWIHANVDPTRKRAYLIDPRGGVLVHSERAFNAGDFSRTDAYVQGVKPIFANLTSSPGSRTRTGAFRAIDQASVRAAVSKLPDLPLAVVVEEVSDIDRVAQRAQWLKWIGQGTFALGALALLVFLASLATREKVIAFVSEAMPQAAPNPAPVIPRVSVEKPAPKSVRPPAPSADALLDQFSRLAPQVKDTPSLLALVTDTVARISKTQVLFFKFDESLKHLFLQFDAGFDRSRAPAAMACPFTDQAIRDAFEISRSGELISVTGYPPLQRLLSERLGVSFYEAWGVTSSISIPAHAPRVKIPRLLGVLVILHPNFEVATRRDSLFKILRTTSQTHELQS